MEWSKVKNIILLMLIVTNLLLLLFVAGPFAQTGLVVDESLGNALTILSERDISIDPKLIPTAVTQTSQTLTADRSGELLQAQGLLGADVSTQSLGGDIFLYDSPLGSLRFHTGGEFSGQFPATSFPLADKTTEEHSTAFLSALGLDATLTRSEPVAGGFSVTYTQLWDGVPLLDYDITLGYLNGSLVTISDSRRLDGIGTPTASATLPVSTALMHFLSGLHQLGDVCRSITAITPAYSADTNLSGLITLTPVWCMETDTNSYQLNLVTGALTRI